MRQHLPLTYYQIKADLRLQIVGQETKNLPERAGGYQTRNKKLSQPVQQFFYQSCIGNYCHQNKRSCQ